MPSQDYTADNSSNRCFECLKIQLFEPMCDNASSAVVFPDYLEGNWQTNGCVPLRIDCSTLFKWDDCDISSFFSKKQAIICLEVREQILLDLAHLETSLQSTAVYIRAHTRKSTIHNLSRCHRRVSKHRDRIFGAFQHEPFFGRLTNCVGSNENKLF